MALVKAATNSLIALRTLVSAEIHRYAERPQLPPTGRPFSACWSWLVWVSSWLSPGLRWQGWSDG